jgi:ATP-dependent helicase/nuclease subunit B
MTMMPFLQRLAQEIATRFGDDPGQLCVVLPNRRAGLYLKKYLAATLRKASWTPQTFSVEDFITHISGSRIIDPVGLLFECYAIHKEIKGADAQDFESFADWGQVLLQDFDEIDQYMVDPDKIFHYLNEARAITVWNLGETPLTDHEKDYIAFYQSFAVYYQKLRERLHGKNLAYRGLAYRLAAENIESIAAGLPWKRIFFAGLNALAGAEEIIIDHLIRNDKAEIFFDADHYYINDPMQEAGGFIRKYLQKWPSNPARWLEDRFRNDHKTIRVYGIPKGMGMAMKAGELVRELKKGDDPPDATAVVLADEKLLLPVLYSLPEDTGPVNVTMGYPLKYTHLYQLVYQLFQMQGNAENYRNRDKGKAGAIYVKDLLKVLAHPYLYLWDSPVGEFSAPAGLLREAIMKRNRVFMNPSGILSLAEKEDESFRSLLSILLSFWASPGQGMDLLLQTLEMIRDRMVERQSGGIADHQQDLEYVFHFSKIIRQCRTMMEEYPFIVSLKSLQKIFFQITDITRLPFYGEPLSGIQVMGVLETRAIDFENLVVLSVNEGILPSGRVPNSFIPFDVKTDFGLPTYRQKDAVFAYHFYRMLQRAHHIYLLYDTESDAVKGGEKSRFITQITYELRQYNPHITIDEKLLAPPPPSGTIREIIIPKTETTLAKLKEMAEKGFSPTALNLYIRCPLQFYFQEILGLAEEETIEETIEAKTMGIVVHDVLQQVFKPFTGRFVNPMELQEGMKDIETLLKKAFRKHFAEGDIEHGKNHLIYRVSLFLLNKWIQTEIGLLNEEANPLSALKIIELERSLKSHLTVIVKDEPLEIRIKGKADRIDAWNGTIRVIDYKTGNVNASDLNLKSWDTLTTDPKMAKVFQLLLYAYLYFRENKTDAGKLETGNITLRKISEGFMKVKLPDSGIFDQEAVENVEEQLTGLLETIFDPETPFTQTEDMETCEYCPFRAICTR